MGTWGPVAQLPGITFFLPPPSYLQFLALSIPTPSLFFPLRTYSSFRFILSDPISLKESGSLSILSLPGAASSSADGMWGRWKSERSSHRDTARRQAGVGGGLVCSPILPLFSPFAGIPIFPPVPLQPSPSLSISHPFQISAAPSHR
jgi:hypothetical protein